MKGTEINALLTSVSTLMPDLDKKLQADVEVKAKDLQSEWRRMKEVLDQRAELATLYVKFHTLIVELAAPVDSLSERLSEHPSESKRSQLEEQLNTIKQLYAQLGTVADNFKQDSFSVSQLSVIFDCLLYFTVIEKIGDIYRNAIV